MIPCFPVGDDINADINLAEPARNLDEEFMPEMPIPFDDMDMGLGQPLPEDLEAPQPDPQPDDRQSAAEKPGSYRSKTHVHSIEHQLKNSISLISDADDFAMPPPKKLQRVRKKQTARSKVIIGQLSFIVHDC